MMGSTEDFFKIQDLCMFVNRGKAGRDLQMLDRNGVVENKEGPWEGEVKVGVGCRIHLLF